MAGHSWEQPPVKRFAHSWENRPGPDPDDDFDAGQWGVPSDSDSEGEDKDTPGHLLVRKILHMHLLNKIHSRRLLHHSVFRSRSRCSRGTAVCKGTREFLWKVCRTAS